MQPKIYISYSPSKLGAVFALFYFEAGDGLYGWHIEAKSLYFSAAYFMVEHFYADRAPCLYRSTQDEVYGLWSIDYPPTKNPIRCPVPEAVGHELDRMQSRFVEEWLFFKDDVHIEPELLAYASLDLPVQEVNIKSKRLQRLHKAGGVWTHATPGLDPNVPQLLRKYWRLSEKVPAR